MGSFCDPGLRQPMQSCRPRGLCLGKPCSMCFVLSSGVVFGLQTLLPWSSRISLSHLWRFGWVDFLWAALFIRASSLQCSRVAVWLPRSWWSCLEHKAASKEWGMMLLGSLSMEVLKCCCDEVHFYLFWMQIHQWATQNKTSLKWYFDLLTPVTNSLKRS